MHSGVNKIVLLYENGATLSAIIGWKEARLSCQNSWGF